MKVKKEREKKNMESGLISKDISEAAGALNVNREEMKSIGQRYKSNQTTAFK